MHVCLCVSEVVEMLTGRRFSPSAMFTDALFMVSKTETAVLMSPKVFSPSSDVLFFKLWKIN